MFWIGCAELPTIPRANCVLVRVEPCPAPARGQQPVVVQERSVGAVVCLVVLVPEVLVPEG